MKYNLNLPQQSNTSSKEDSDTMAALGQAGLSSDDLQQIASSRQQSVQPTPQTSDDEDYSSMSKEDLDSARKGGITKEDLDALHKHEGVNMWTSLFMNLVGAGKGIKPGTGQEPLNASLEQHRQGLDLKQKLANSQSERAAQEQRMGLTDLNLNQAKREQGLAQQPINTLQKGLMYALIKQNKLNGVDPNDVEGMTQEQFKQNFDPQKDVVGLGLREQQLQNMQLALANKGLRLVKNEFTGQYEVKDVNHMPISNGGGGNSVTPQAPNANFSDTGGINPRGPLLNVKDSPNQSAPQNSTYDYSNINGGIPGLNPADVKDIKKGLDPLKKQAQKIAQDESDFNLSKDNLKSYINESINNKNYVASRDLPAKEAAMFEGLKGRLTNMQIQMNKNGEQSGVVNQIQGFLTGLAGRTRITEQDARNMVQLMDVIDQNTKQHFNSQRNRLRDTAKGLTNKANINYDKELFGATPENVQSQGSSQQTIAPATQSFEDYFSKRGK